MSFTNHPGGNQLTYPEIRPVPVSLAIIVEFSCLCGTHFGDYACGDLDTIRILRS